MSVAIIGAGLAGCAAAYFLRREGISSTIYERENKIASAASGNDVGLYNPRFTAEYNAQAAFYSQAFALALSVFEELEGIDWTPCGALHLITDEKKARRFPQTLENWGWGEDGMKILTAAQAGQVAGVDMAYDALYLPRSGFVSPRKLCEKLAEGIDVIYGAELKDLKDIDANHIILAAGMGCAFLSQIENLPLKPVRGQVSTIEATEKSKNLKVTIGYGGYLAPALQGVHCVGSSFQPWLNHNEIIPQDDLDNIEKLGKFVPGLAAEYRLINHRAGVRITSKDHFPVIGKILDKVYISTAHGSHGILSALMGGKILAEMITKQDQDHHREILGSLSPHRFT